MADGRGSPATTCTHGRERERERGNHRLAEAKRE